MQSDTEALQVCVLFLPECRCVVRLTIDCPYSVVEVLLRHEADPSHPNAKGRNALHFAARHDCPDAIRAISKFVELSVRISFGLNIVC